MSSGEKIPWSEAFELAEEVSARIQGVTARSKAAGSLRRRRPVVGDLEFVVEPHFDLSLLEDRRGPPNIDIIFDAAARLGKVETKRKPLARQITVRDLLGREGFTLELYVVHPPAQWGSILGIRTGPSDLGPAVMSLIHMHTGRRHRGGFIPGHPTPDERSFFAAARLPLVSPTERDALAARLLADRDAGWPEFGAGKRGTHPEES